MKIICCIKRQSFRWMNFRFRKGIQIRLRKFIPVAAGMAGGMKYAAAVLFGVNKMFRLGMSTEQLMERGVRIGADVPYCILRGTASF